MTSEEIKELKSISIGSQVVPELIIFGGITLVCYLIVSIAIYWRYFS